MEDSAVIEAGLHIFQKVFAGDRGLALLKAHHNVAHARLYLDYRRPGKRGAAKDKACAKNKNCQCEKFLHSVKHRPGDGPPVKSFAALWTGLSALAQQRRNSTPPACRQGHKHSLTPCPLRKKPYLLIQSVFICQDFLASRCAFRFCLSFPCMLTSIFGTKETSLRTFSWKSCPYSHTQSRPLRGKDIALQHPKTIFAQPRRQWS